ncbi:hypothetical protein EBQ91_01575 [bacterium]|nr:hypothetical protein [bacterium]
MGRWLSTSVLVVVITISTVSISDWAACMFYLLPQAGANERTTSVCKSPGERAAGTLSALLATLLGLGVTPPKER